MDDANKPLLLASTSSSRQQLLKDARIPFTLIGQSADESQCDWSQSLEQVVTSIACYKMNHALVPAGSQPGDICYVLTADTLSQDAQGVISGKPKDYEQAVAMLKAARGGMITATAFCLERKVWRSGSWQTDKRVVECVSATYQFNVPDSWIATYIDQAEVLQASGAIKIEGFGALFLESVQGSYSAIVGLSMSQVRQALERLGFSF
jgi:septum formation protein